MPLFRLLISMFCFFATEGIFAQQNHPISPGRTLGSLAVAATTTNPTCATRIQPTATSRLGNGSVNATATGGTPPYTYSISLGGPYQTNGYFPDLDMGNYRVVVTDAAGATAYTDLYLGYTLSQPLLAVNILQLPSTCTSKDGSLELVPYFGTPPYTYSLDGGFSFQSGTIVTNLAQGYYQIFYLKDANGCIAEGITASNPSVPNYFMCTFCCPLQIDMVFDKLACTNDGQATLSVNMPGPIYFSLDGINYSPGNGYNAVVNTFYNLTPGSYSVYAKNDLGYTGGLSFIMPEACATTSLTFTTTDPGCNQNNGSISVSAAFGTAPYSYSLDGINFQSSNIFSGLTAGSYQISVKDAGGTLSTGFTNLKNICPQVTAKATNAQCSGSNASITATGSGGTTPYMYSIDGINFQSGNLFAGLVAGNYIVTLKDGAGQTAIVPILVTGTSIPLITEASIPPFCDNSSGTITITATGVQPLQYSFDNGLTYQSSNVLPDITAGSYPVKVQDANGCTAGITPTAITYPSTPVFLGNDTSLCAGNGIYLAAPSSVLYQYQWQDNSTLDHFNVFQSGMYFVKLTNEHNCSTSDTIMVRFNPLPVFSLGKDTTICVGTVLKLNPAVSGNYQWSTGSQSPVINITNDGLYWLQVDKQNCSFRDSILVGFKPKPVIHLGNDTSLCVGESLILNVTNPGAVYHWQDGSSNPVYQVENPGNYSVKVSLNGCDTSGKINVGYTDKPQVQFGGDTTLCVTQHLLLDAFSPGSDYLWQDGSGLPQYQVTQPGNYSVQVTNGCGSVNESLVVQYENCDCHFYIPNAFTPNHDGKNDVFRPRWVCLFDRYDLKIFNRWGQLVFNSSDPDTGWDGNMGGMPQADGGYIWIISYHDLLTNQNKQKKGTLILTR
jgi:gliding motility-associated-like protein